MLEQTNGTDFCGVNKNTQGRKITSGKIQKKMV
jgi:hypothetical protein